MGGMTVTTALTPQANAAPAASRRTQRQRSGVAGLVEAVLRFDCQRKIEPATTAKPMNAAMCRQAGPLGDQPVQARAIISPVFASRRLTCMSSIAAKV